MGLSPRPVDNPIRLYETNGPHQHTLFSVFAQPYTAKAARSGEMYVLIRKESFETLNSANIVTC